MSEPREREESSTSFTGNVDDILGLDVNIEGPDKPGLKANKPKRGYRNVTEDHLLSVRGLKYLRTNAAKRVRSKLNHKDEFKNLHNLLSFYQIWGHNLFPRANFPDFLSMCAVTGTKRRVRRQREEWIQEDMDKERAENNKILYSNAFEGHSDQDVTQNDQESNGNTVNQDDNEEEEERVRVRAPVRNALFVRDDEDDEDDEDDDDLYTTSNVHPNTTSGSVPIRQDGGSDKNPNEANLIEAANQDPQPPSTDTTLNKDPAEEDEFPDFEDEFEDQYAAEMDAMNDI